MADQDYPTLYAEMEDAAQRTRTAAIAFEKVLGGGEALLVPVNGFPDQPTIAGRVKARMDPLVDTLESAAEAVKRFAGVHAVAPTTRYDGTPLQPGDEYQNSVSGLRYAWSGSSWVVLNASVQQLASALADDTDPAGGAGIPAFTPGVAYPAGSSGAFLNAFAEDDNPEGGAGISAYTSGLAYPVGSVGDFLNKLALRAAPILVPALFGIRTVEQGATDPLDTKARFETMRLEAQSLGATVIIPSGTYLLPPAVPLDSDNTEWIFAPGSLLKLWDTQVTSQDFLTFNAPVNQRVRGLRFDANRAAQNSATFGIDKCGCVVIDPAHCVFTDTHVVSSPSKGFAVVGSYGGIVDTITIDGITGGNCNNQAVLLDGNNMMSSWRRGYVNRVRIGETSHAGIAINDGVHNVQFGLIDCDVNNSTWDAVSIRDCWDLQFTVTYGRRGRNGIQIFSLNDVSRRIHLGSSMLGIGNAQSGTLINQANEISGGAVGGFNNGIAGLNVAQRNVNGTLVRCKDITIEKPIGFDNRVAPAAPTQQYGMLVAGCDGAVFGKPRAYGNTTKQVTVVRSASTDIDLKWERRVDDIPFTVASGGTVDVTVTWPDSGFEDTLYDIDLETDVTSAGLSIWSANVRAKLATGCTIHIVALAGSAGSGTLSARARRRP